MTCDGGNPKTGDKEFRRRTREREKGRGEGADRLLEPEQVAYPVRGVFRGVDNVRFVMAEVERLERKYNGGQPFPAVGARELPQGRPMGE